MCTIFHYRWTKCEAEKSSTNPHCIGSNDSINPSYLCQVLPGGGEESSDEISGVCVATGHAGAAGHRGADAVLDAGQVGEAGGVGA